MANGRLQSRQVFWRRGTSTSEQRRTPTGHAGETVTQRTVTRLGPSEHRGGHRGSGGANLQALTSSAVVSAYPMGLDDLLPPGTQEAVEAAAAVDAQNASIAAWKFR